jgi:hypothetical protein
MRLILVFILSLNHHLISQTVDSIYCINVKSNSYVILDNDQKIKFIDKYVEGSYKYNFADSCFKDINLKVYYDSFFVAKFSIKNFNEFENEDYYHISSLEVDIGSYFDSVFNDLDRDFLIEYKCEFDSIAILNYNKKIIYFNSDLIIDFSIINDKYILNKIFEKLKLHRLRNENSNYIDVRLIIDSNAELYIIFKNNVFENKLNLRRYLNF